MPVTIPAFARPQFDAFEAGKSVPGLHRRTQLSPEQASAKLTELQDRFSLWRGLDESAQDLMPGRSEVKTMAYGLHGARIGQSHCAYGDSKMQLVNPDPFAADGSAGRVTSMHFGARAVEALIVDINHGTTLFHVSNDGLSGYLLAPGEKPPLDPKFFGNAQLQAQAPKAFGTSPAAQKFFEKADSRADRARLLEAIRGDAELMDKVSRFDQMGWDERIPVMQQVFDLECQTLGMTPPELRIENGITPGPAFFDFNLENPTPGRVLLNPAELDKEKDGFAGLLLLVHETRHSLQFQQAFGLLPGADPDVAEGYRAAYKAQKELSGKMSFVDFCVLLNEYEAFQFGNDVVGQLSGGRADTSGMGTLASQFDEAGNPRLDLPGLFREVGPEGVLDAFNELERPHYDQLHGRSRSKCC